MGVLTMTVKEIALRRILIEAKNAWPQFDLDPSQALDSELYVSGADMIEWFIDWRQRAIDVLYQTS
jgi:hypothetical protein